MTNGVCCIGTGPPSMQAAATDWQVIATGIVNRDEGEEPFVLDATGRTLSVASA